MNADADPDHPPYGRLVVFTGGLMSMTRQQAWEELARLGGVPEQNVTKPTNLLVAGDINPAGSCSRIGYHRQGSEGVCAPGHGRLRTIFFAPYRELLAVESGSIRHRIGNPMQLQSLTHTTGQAAGSNCVLSQVDLEHSYPVDEITIWNRTDCCADRLSDYWVISDSPITAGSLEDTRTTPGVKAIHESATDGRPTRIKFDNLPGRYIRVQIASGSNPLALDGME